LWPPSPAFVPLSSHPGAICFCILQPAWAAAFLGFGVVFGPELLGRARKGPRI
jgi:hypothetical protein